MNIIQKISEKKQDDIIDYLNLIPKNYGKENRNKIIYYICMICLHWQYAMV